MPGARSPLLYTVLFGLGAIYNGLGTYLAVPKEEKLRWWQAGIIGWIPFFLPMALMAMFYR
jgi:hypothetical protein